VTAICDLVTERDPTAGFQPREKLITCVSGRPGHDTRYAIDAKKIRFELGWEPAYTFDSGLESTVDWYLANRPWGLALRQRV